MLGSAVTKIKLEQKEREGTAEANSGRRNVGSVWGSGSAGVLCAALALAYPQYDSILRLGFVASFCSKLSDTTASEVGKAYGKTTYNSLPPFNSVPRGTEGAVSLEGTLAGIAASFVFAGVAALLGELNTATSSSSPLLAAAVCAFAAFVATTFESALGSLMQGRKGWEWLTNDVVNAIQIAIAAIVATRWMMRWHRCSSHRRMTAMIATRRRALHVQRQFNLPAIWKCARGTTQSAASTPSSERMSSLIARLRVYSRNTPRQLSHCESISSASRPPICRSRLSQDQRRGSTFQLRGGQAPVCEGSAGPRLESYATQRHVLVSMNAVPAVVWIL